ncbi:ribosome-associated ATPase/putative transporter RbbA [Aurantimonas sp. VKM B-3413]|uniref:ribosome-associated ATPase/putative transporter RbbA n=1 Tax=Aurantimonas sp. VKM B-3413 TaxID=2779401 RepID=UPI001E3A4AFD|nr:ribosome-associated ATPase/putative transporter RbbA [Aurantimonas sp. VKM B-3413]MCB8839902.1 ribosome-associated ATPase/putative transporter RbbA [Aurantimonas sp. VKM B-3413]
MHSVSEEPIVELCGVTHRYGAGLALDRLDLAIPAGCMAGLIGPDGVGKSTLLALAAGVRRIQAGTVRVLGGDMASAAQRRQSSPRIAYMPQGLGKNLYPTLSVTENLDFFGRLFGHSAAERRRRIADLLNATGLAPFPDRPAGKLSGGMKQKLALCCALIHDPDFLILDEPTTGVDPLSRRQFWDLIDSIRARRPGMSVLVATAYMEEAERFDWLAAMHAGRVIATGTPAEMLTQADAKTLEAAFIALLPEAARAGHVPVAVPPRPASDDGAPAIEAENLTCRFGDFTAVDHVSFRIERGEIFGFIGSNGCGKTTTMKMLTGLLQPTEGSARLFGQAVDAREMEARRNVGYMSQGFSLYEELTVRQNLELHARLFQVPAGKVASRVDEMLARYGLIDHADRKPEGLPLGIRQRLQLAVAVIHRPAILILDEPTSGVDPIARDAFWRSLIQLSREDGVTIFISTHFMNEAERCDRISLMHAGRVLAVGIPQELAEERKADSLEDAFIGYLEEASGIEAGAKPAAEEPPATAEPSRAPKKPRRFSLMRLSAYARREAVELMRDRIRLFFALAGPIILTITFGYGISFDVENLRFAAFDQDHSPESRELVEQFSSSRYFEEQPSIGSAAEMERRMTSGDITFVIEIPDGYGRDRVAGRPTEISVTLDGAMPFRAETARGYVVGLANTYVHALASEGARETAGAYTLLPRFRFNQTFRSVNAMVPSIMMLMLVLIPAIMAAVGVVREKETGSIANFRSTPISKVEFLLGKQLPYIAISLVSAVTLVLLAITLFKVPLQGSVSLLAVATAIYVTATTGFGQFLSCFTRTQVAAIFATAILSVIPAVNFSGLIVPVSSLEGFGRYVGLAFPSAWYQPVTAGCFTKGLGWSELWPNLLALAGFAVGFLVLSQFALKKQES